MLVVGYHLVRVNKIICRGQRKLGFVCWSSTTNHLSFCTRLRLVELERELLILRNIMQLALVSSPGISYPFDTLKAKHSWKCPNQLPNSAVGRNWNWNNNWNKINDQARAQNKCPFERMKFQHSIFTYNSIKWNPINNLEFISWLKLERFSSLPIQFGIWNFN